VPDPLCFGLLYHQLAILDHVAERDAAAHPHALAPRGGKLVPDALSGHLALELGKGEQHVKREPAHAGRGVELLGNRDEGDAMRVQDLDDLGEVGERAGEAVDLVDDDQVHLAGPDIGQKLLEGGTLEGAA
jgi:hypothetical protein